MPVVPGRFVVDQRSIIVDDVLRTAKTRLVIRLVHHAVVQFLTEPIQRRSILIDDGLRGRAPRLADVVQLRRQVRIFAFENFHPIEITAKSIVQAGQFFAFALVLNAKVVRGVGIARLVEKRGRRAETRLIEAAGRFLPRVALHGRRTYRGANGRRAAERI